MRRDTSDKKRRWTRKPMARVQRVALFQREVRERLSEAALDVLLARAELISEGQIAPLSREENRYYGSTMLTLNLSGASPFFREPMDAAAAARVADMLGKDPRVIPRFRALALKEAERVSGAKLAKLEMEIAVDARGENVLVDLDVEATLASDGRSSKDQAG